ncbi:MAG: PAS domain-containing protein [Clostridiales bacterium]|nr:PAS domain-containing protein [Clostridiales bacterium]
MEKETIMLLDALHRGLTITDAEGKLVYMSESFAEFFGIDKNEAVGRNISYYENTNILKPSITRMVLEKKKTVKATQRDAKGRELLGTGVPIYDNNELKYVVCFNSWDFLTPSELQIKYEKLKAKNDRLEAELISLKKPAYSRGRLFPKAKLCRTI